MGVPTLALAAGALLASLWADTLTPIVANAGFVVTKPPLVSLVSILVMLRSHKSPSHHRSVLGSIVFAVLGVVLTYGAFSNAVVLDQQSAHYVTEFVKYQNAIITVCVGLALAEIVFQKSSNHHENKKK